MVIILEGCDKCGKSTLAKVLSEKTGYPIVHFGAPKDRKECDEMFDMYRDYLGTHDDVILDRSWYSDLVYGPIFRGRPSMNNAQVAMLERIVSRKGCVLYHCYDSAENIMKRVGEQGDEYTTAETVQNILDCFSMVMSSVYPTIQLRQFKIPEGNYGR